MKLPRSPEDLKIGPTATWGGSQGSTLGSDLFTLLGRPLGLGPVWWQGVGNRQSACGSEAKAVGDDGAAVGAANVN